MLRLRFRAELRDECVPLREDNTVREGVIRNACSKSPVMMEEYRLLWAVNDELHISSKVVRVASTDDKAEREREIYIHKGLKDPSGVGSSSRGLHLLIQAHHTLTDRH
jgi:hypothetical protein